MKVQQINAEAQVKALETDLDSLKKTVTGLKDKNKDLGKKHF